MSRCDAGEYERLVCSIIRPLFLVYWTLSITFAGYLPILIFDGALAFHSLAQFATTYLLLNKHSNDIFKGYSKNSRSLWWEYRPMYFRFGKNNWIFFLNLNLFNYFIISNHMHNGWSRTLHQQTTIFSLNCISILRLLRLFRSNWG